MHIHFSNCETVIEVLYFIFSFLMVLTFIISGMMVFSNEKELEGKDAIFNSIFSLINLFFTGKYLNKKGKKWRVPFISSILGIVLVIIIAFYFKPCLAQKIL